MAEQCVSGTITSTTPVQFKSSSCDVEEKLLDITGRQFLSNANPDGSDMTKNTGDRPASPAPSSALSSIQDVASPQQKPSDLASTADINPRPKKRQKLSTAEKEAQQREKEQKAQEKAAKKAQRDEENRLKEEEKQIKQNERRKKAEEVEAKKREKETEKEQRRQEELKESRRQTRLGGFFKPAPTQQAAESPEKGSTSARRRSLSLETFDDMQSQIEQHSRASPKPGGKPPSIASPKVLPARKSGYHDYFLPFALKPGTTVFRPSQISHDSLVAAQLRFDRATNAEVTGEEYDLGLRNTKPSLSSYFRKTDQAVKPEPPPESIDLTSEFAGEELMRLLSEAPIRFLHFQEDVRPAYFGTYTKMRDGAVSKKTRRNPFARTRSDTNYDYDSEAEWEADPEGEDLGDEDSEADSVDDDSELGNFIDDEDDRLKDRPKALLVAKQPFSTGLCWEDHKGKMPPGSAKEALVGLRMQFLIVGQTSPIDPFCSSYWSSTARPNADKNKSVTTPARVPLREKDSNSSSADRTSGLSNSVKEKPGNAGKKATRVGTQKVMTASDLEAFKAAIAGSTLSKNELITMLKDKYGR